MESGFRAVGDSTDPQEFSGFAAQDVHESNDDALIDEFDLDDFELNENFSNNETDFGFGGQEINDNVPDNTSSVTKDKAAPVPTQEQDLDDAPDQWLGTDPKFDNG